MAQNDTIIIDLTQPLTSGKVETASLLQVQAKKRLDELLGKFKQNAVKNAKDNSEENKEPWAQEFNTQRFNNTVFISGQRGSGKTTFLRTVLLERLNDKKDQILPVALIDPTLVETHQHILVDIIAKFKQLVSIQLPGCGNEKNHIEFNEKLEAMAEGLKLLGSNSKSSEQDAAWFLNKALKHAVGGQTLEAKFHELIDVAAKILGQKLFIIAFDDVDTDTSKAYDVLELIRRYLTHPQLAVLISGDPQLYSHIVQGQKIKELSYDNYSFKDAEEYKKNTDKLVAHLEQQYLAKVLPIEQRVELKKLSDLISIDKQIIEIRISEDKSSQIKWYLTSLLSHALNLRGTHASSYVQFLITQPIRTVLQILKNNYESAPDKKQAVFIISLMGSYIGALRKENISIDSLTGGSIHPNAIGLALFNICYKYGELETGFYARPDSNNESYNASQIYLSSIMANYLSTNTKSSSGRALQLMLTAGATCNVYMNHVEDKLKDGAGSEEYIKYIGLNRDQNMFSLAAHFSPFILNDSNRKQINAGVIRIPRSKQTNFQNRKFKGLLDQLSPHDSSGSTRFTSISSLDKYHNNSQVSFIEYLASKTILISTHSMMTKNGGRDYISVYCLLASLSELLTCEHIDRKLSQLSFIQTFGSPSFVEIKGEDSFIDELEPKAIDTSFEHENSLIDLLENWKADNQGAEFSSLLIGKVWARIMYSITAISDKAKGKIKYNDNETYDILLGSVFSRFIWGIIYAILIEEVRFGIKNNRYLIEQFVNAKNVATSADELITNLNTVFRHIGNIPDSHDGSKFLKVAREFQEILPLTYTLITCPLIFPYLGKVDNNESTNSVYDLLFPLLKVIYPESLSNTNFPESKDFSPALKFVSRLPVMGCFYKEPIKSSTKSVSKSS